MELWQDLNGGRGYDERSGKEFVIVESHVKYLSELQVEDAFQVISTVVSYDPKRMYLLNDVVNEDGICASVLLVCLSFDTTDRKVKPFAGDVLERLEEYVDRQILEGHPMSRLTETLTSKKG